MFKKLMLCAALTLLGAAQAARGIIPGTQAIWIEYRDPITDENAGSVAMVAEQGTDVYIRFSCVNGEFQVMLNTQSELVSAEDWENDEFPEVIVRVDATTPFKGASNGTLSASDGEASLDSLSFVGFAPLVSAAFESARSRVVVRVVRNHLSPLDFVFPPQGFKEAMARIGKCG